MNNLFDSQNLDSSSMPSFFDKGTGAGSLFASMFSQGLFVCPCHGCSSRARGRFPD